MSSKQALRCPWPYFGGKSAVAGLVWERLGRVDNVIEPFCGSAAFLLARPNPPGVETVNDQNGTLSNFQRSVHPEHGNPGAVADYALETVNDACPYLANAWRSIAAEPEATAEWADYPVDESYLHAVHRWLVLGDEAEAFRRRMRTDPDYYDPRRAGRWIFGLCCWIGSGWCSTGAESQQMPSMHPVAGVHASALPQQVPAGQGPLTGVHAQPDLTAKRPTLGGDNPGSYGKGVHAKGELSQQVPGMIGGKDARGINGQPELTQQLPDLGSGRTSRGGMGVHGVGDTLKGGRPQLADAYDVGRGVHSHGELGTCDARRAWLLDWFRRLRDRFRTVRVCCGDWSRVCSSESVTIRLGVTGVFMDPPYSLEAKRCNTLYSQESGTVAHDVRAWCLEYGRNPLMRICLAGYELEGHEVLEAEGWTVVAWESQGGYGNRSKKGKANRKKERLFFSPFCLTDGPLFAKENQP